MRVARALVSIIVPIVAISLADHVGASEPLPIWQVGDDQGHQAVDVNGQAAGSDAGVQVHHSSGGWKLLYVETGDMACDPNQDGVADPIYVYMTPDGNLQQICSDPTPPAPVPRFFAEETSKEMTLPLAGVEMSPSESKNQLVNLATWLWVDNWAPIATSATLRGVTVTVTARPESVSWDMGAGDPPVTCGAGKAYDTSVPDDRQQTDCSYTYRGSSFGQPDERFHGAATMRWAVSWTSSTGESGVLPGLSTSRPFALRVTEGEAVVTDAR